jgi:hypothetical protein
MGWVKSHLELVYPSLKAHPVANLPSAALTILLHLPMFERHRIIATLINKRINYYRIERMPWERS